MTPRPVALTVTGSPLTPAPPVAAYPRPPLTTLEARLLMMMTLAVTTAPLQPPPHPRPPPRPHPLSLPLCLLRPLLTLPTVCPPHHPGRLTAVTLRPLWNRRAATFPRPPLPLCAEPWWLCRPVMPGMGTAIMTLCPVDPSRFATTARPLPVTPPLPSPLPAAPAAAAVVAAAVVAVGVVPRGAGLPALLGHLAARRTPVMTPL